MTKLEETLQANPEMGAIEITRLEVVKVSEPTLRAALVAIVDLFDLYMGPYPDTGGQGGQVSPETLPTGQEPPNPASPVG